MTLRILKASEPLEVKQLVACIYAQPGLGKTSAAFTTDAPLLIDFDKGAHRSAFRKDTVQVESWSDVANITPEDLKGYKTLVLDTAGRALDWLTADIIGKNPKMGRGAGALTLPGFGELRSQFVSFTKHVRSMGLDIVLIVHSDEQKSGDETIERLDMQGSSKNEIYKSADLMGRILLRNGKRVLTFNPTDTAFGKNPAALPEFEVPHFAQDPHFLGRILADTKAALNQASVAQQQAASALADWQAKFGELADVESFNTMIGEVKENAPADVRENVGRLLTKAAKAKGFIFDKKAGQYAAAQQVA
jgi:hypothetical protein